jgi:hypothetical protein
MLVISFYHTLPESTSQNEEKVVVHIAKSSQQLSVIFSLYFLFYGFIMELVKKHSNARK